MSEDEVKMEIRKRYAKVARHQLEREDSAACCGAGGEADSVETSSCGCSATAQFKTLLESIGYPVSDLPSFFTESFAGCGNPVAIAELREGDTVLDLGSGAGLDAFIAAKKVGPNGRVIGIDMTPEMVEKANTNAARVGASNLEFRLGEVESLPIEDDSVDVVISNCVINLVPDKTRVFREAFRVLRMGGRLVVSDIILERPLNDAVRDNIDAYTACISGAILESEYLKIIADAGFRDIRTMSKHPYGPAASVIIRAMK
ncbi:MAG: arsenite methyltransferase [Candidatus Thorarchaeota archaeon]|nr:arsenite methyltransferase [Candidatus Thorarchaeota archaeon]